MADGLKVIKLRLHEVSVIDGIAQESKALRMSEVNLIRKILSDHFNHKETAVSTPTTNLPSEVIEKIENSETLSRILVRKIFDLNESELRDLLNKAKSN